MPSSTPTAYSSYLADLHTFFFAQPWATALTWLVNACVLTSTYLAGNRRRSAWLLGIAGQFCFIFWMHLTDTWGFLPMTVGMIVIFSRNYVHWALLPK